ncbi:unnamed protein product [Rhizoctonia solani]|uniref:MYND-type domain-containing protein n=2 Tax=Rhizoctonia solani TaxID=456999 RepID=A0A8H3GHY6_9AGAM|nr:unnamed protein product [Rhizoctonia solani]
MGNPVHFHWGLPLEQYVLHYDKAFLRGQINLEEEVVSSATKCIQIIIIISEEGDEAKIDSLAKKITLAMLHSVLLLSLSMRGILYLARPGLITGCTRLMKTVKVDGMISPFSYEYGYLCFNIGKMALGICLVEKFHKQNIFNLMERIHTEHQTRDNASLLTEYLSKLFLDETQESPREPRCAWIFGWSNPPAHSGHSGLIVSESDALDLMNVLCNDRKALLKSLSSTYTPGSSVILFLIWQYMIRKGLQRELPDPHSRPLLLGPFLDLLWRFTLVTTPSDYGFIFSATMAGMSHLGKLTEGAVDVEDSRTIINTYIKGIPSGEITESFHQVALVVYHSLPRFVVRSILPGTENLFAAFVQAMLSRAWEMIVWEEMAVMPPMGVVAGGLDDLLLFLQAVASRLPPHSPVMRAILEQIVDNDLLGLIGFSIHRLYPNRVPDTSGVYTDLSSCIEFRNVVRTMIAALVRASSTSIAPSYFQEYTTEWVKHLQYNDILLQMRGNGDKANAWAKFRRDLLWDVIKLVGSGDDVKKCLDSRRRLACSYARCPNPSWAGYVQLCCSSCTILPERANYCSPRCQVLDWTCEGKSHKELCPRSN